MHSGRLTANRDGALAERQPKKKFHQRSDQRNEKKVHTTGEIKERRRARPQKILNRTF